MLQVNGVVGATLRVRRFAGAQSRETLMRYGGMRRVLRARASCPCVLILGAIAWLSLAGAALAQTAEAPQAPDAVAPEPPEPSPVPPAPATTAPPPARASQAQISKWQRDIVMQFERHKAYPRAARERGETGVVQLDFTIDRQGRVTSSAISKSSGSEALDQETLATLHRAQPFRAPPADADGATFEFRLPVKFNMR